MNDKFLKVAKQAALEAGKIISYSSGKNPQYHFKNNDKSNFATIADFQAEAKIVEILEKNFPDHNIIAEEKARKNKGSRYTWVIDPLDGTFSFAHGIPYFSVSIGLLVDHTPVLGVIYRVASQSLYFAKKDQGAYLNEKPIQVSRISALAESACGLEFAHRNTREGNLESYVKPLIIKIGYPYSVGSVVASQALVAEGTLDGYVSEAWIWDYAAGTVIVREAGGKVTNFEGKEPDWTKDRLSIVASNGLIHDQILEALKK